MIEQTVSRMNGDLYMFVLAKQEGRESEIASFILQKIDALIQLFNFFDKSSLLSELNKKRTVPFQANLAFLLEKSIEFNQHSDGLFDVCLGREIRERKQNTSSVNKSKREKIKTKDAIEISDSQIRLLDPNCDIDLGGIAKGYIIDVALDKAIQQFGSLLIDIFIDARGDIISYGKNRKFISVENPFDNTVSFSELKIRSGAIITSGHNKQKFTGGSHILGEKSDILTVSLYSKKRKCFELDALGTYLSQLASNDVLEKIEFDNYFQDIDCLLVLEDGNVLKSSFWDANINS